MLTGPRRPTPPDPDGPRRPARLADLAEDPRYLELKERLGETLTPRERFALELYRAAGSPPPKGGES